MSKILGIETDITENWLCPSHYLCRNLKEEEDRNHVAIWEEILGRIQHDNEQ